MNEVELQEEVIQPAIIKAGELRVSTPQDYTDASVFLKEIKAAQKSVKSFFAEMKDKAYKSWKAITAKETGLLKPLNTAEKRVKSVMIEWQEEQDRIAAAEQARLQAKAEAEAERERQRLLKRAEKLKTPELKEEAVQAAQEVVTPIVNVESAAPKESGISFKKTWKGRVTDKKAFLKAASESDLYAAFVNIDQGRLDKFAKSVEGNVEITGVEFYQEKTIASRTR